MCYASFLQMCSFDIILISLHSLNLSFRLLFYVISTAILKFPSWFPAPPSWFPTHFHPDSPHPYADSPHTRIPIPLLAFPPLFPAHPLFPSPIPYFDFYR